MKPSEEIQAMYDEYLGESDPKKLHQSTRHELVINAIIQHLDEQHERSIIPSEK